MQIGCYFRQDGKVYRSATLEEVKDALKEYQALFVFVNGLGHVHVVGPDFQESAVKALLRGAGFQIDHPYTNRAYKPMNNETQYGNETDMVPVSRYSYFCDNHPERVAG